MKKLGRLKAMQRSWLIGALATFSLLGATDAFAERPLAVGEIAGYLPPPGTTLRAIYVPSRGTRWEPTDMSMGRAFRELIYIAPPRYRYLFVRGYRIYFGPARHRQVTAK